MQSSVPVIDLAPWLSGDDAARAAVAAQVDAALQSVGFFLITGHGVPGEMRARIRAQDRLGVLGPGAGAPRGQHGGQREPQNAERAPAHADARTTTPAPGPANRSSLTKGTALFTFAACRRRKEQGDGEVGRGIWIFARNLPISPPPCEFSGALRE